MKFQTLKQAFRFYPDLSSKIVLINDWLFNRKRFEVRMALERRFLVYNFKSGR